MPAPEKGFDLLQSLLEKLREVERVYSDSGTLKHVVHNDPSFGNVLFDQDDPAIVDYDDMKLGHGLIDLGVVWTGPLGRDDFAERNDALLAGYASGAIRPIKARNIGLSMPRFGF